MQKNNFPLAEKLKRNFILLAENARVLVWWGGGGGVPGGKGRIHPSPPPPPPDPGEEYGEAWEENASTLTKLFGSFIFFFRIRELVAQTAELFYCRQTKVLLFI
jgi:hypothetical protein